MILPFETISNVRESSSFSVGQPFQGAYLEINKNPKYKKLKDAIEEKIIIAEVVNKINRANGKVKMLILKTYERCLSVGTVIFSFLNVKICISFSWQSYCEGSYFPLPLKRGGILLIL